MVEAAAPAITGRRRDAMAAWPYLVSQAADGMPLPAISLYVAIGVVTTVGLALRFWALGTPVGVIDQNSLTFCVLLPTILYFFRYLATASDAAVARLQPALASHAEAEAIRRDLAILPARAGWLALLGSAALTLVRYVLDPASSQVAGDPIWAVAIVYVLEVLNVGALFALIAQLVRQTRTIRRVLAEDTIVDIYRPGPLHALSGLTARMGIFLVLMTGVVTFLVAPTGPGGTAVDILSLIPFVVVPTIIAILIFVLPLYGTHNRLVDEKQRLEASADARLQGLVNEINQLIDARRLVEVDPLNKALGAVVQQRDLVARLSTWPWSGGTARALGTAILLPVALFVAQRIVAAGLGLH